MSKTAITSTIHGGRGPSATTFTSNDHIHGLVHLTTDKPLSLLDIRITLYGIANTLIHRRYKPFINYLYWFGRGFLFQRILVLQSGPFTLQPGSYSWPFDFEFPAETERMSENWQNLNKWTAKTRFQGHEGAARALPANVEVQTRHWSGNHDAQILYRLDATTTRGPDAKLLSMALEEPRSINFVPSRDPRRAVRTQLHPVPCTPAPGVTVIFGLPDEMCNGLPLPVPLSASAEGQCVALTSIKISFSSTTLLRGRSLLFGEKRASTRETTSLLSLTNLDIPLGEQPQQLSQLAPAANVKLGLIPTFAVHNVARTGYEMIIEFGVVVQGQGREMRGTVRKAGLEVLGPVFPPQNLTGLQDHRPASNVLSADEYRAVQKERKTSMKASRKRESVKS